jgi:hypothetical protein
MTYQADIFTYPTAPATLHTATDPRSGLILGVYATRAEADAREAQAEGCEATLAALEAA